MCYCVRTNVLLYLIIVSEFLLIAFSLEIRTITIPKTVENGANAILVCEFELGYDTLYSLKWYKGRHEFYRYTPNETPAVKLFLKNDIKVDVS